MEAAHDRRIQDRIRYPTSDRSDGLGDILDWFLDLWLADVR